MQTPLQIRPGAIPLTAEIRAYIDEHAKRLDHLAGGMISGRVVFDAPLAHHRHGGPYEVSVDITIPGAHMVVNRQAGPTLQVALRDAFAAIERQVEESFRRQRDLVRTAGGPEEGRTTPLA
jgi:ribosome-associated translation inhibitor RaiA